jgi:methionyl-tRNA synthetase
MVELYCDGRVPAADQGGASEKALRETAERAVVAHDEHAARLDFSEALAAVFAVVEEANKHFQRTQPWQAVKDPAKRAQVEASLYAGLEAVRLVAYLLFPYMPTVSPRITEVLGVESPASAKWETVATWGLLRPGQAIRVAPSLFPRLERAKTA